VLNKGAKDGVVLNAPVTVFNSTLAGFVTEVYENRSVFRLMIDPLFSVPVILNNEQGDKGLAQGKNYTSILVSTIPRDADARPGQLVVTEGQGITPPGLLVGKIQSVRSEENEAYQEARLELTYTPDEMAAVSILVEP
jgi:cell shape-determining protein MreC